MLLRMTALFICRECGALPYVYPEINVHWQEVHPDKSVWKGVATGFGGEGAYGAEVWEEGAKVAEKMLVVLIEKGLPKDKKDMGLLDEHIEGGQVFCACGDPMMVTPDSEQDLSWETLVDHVFNHLHDNTLRRKSSSGARGSNGTGEDSTPVWLNDHDLTLCIMYLPEDADTSTANKHIAADKSTRKRINALLCQCPETSSPACRLCDVLTSDNRKDDLLFLMANADAIVYHMEAKHGRRFEEGDIVFWDKSVFDKP